MSRLRNLAALPYDYLSTFYWGLFSPRLTEDSPLVVHQAVVLNEGAEGLEILLSVRSDVRGWELPGGRVEDGEDPLDGLVREVEEETGFWVEADRHVGDYVRTGFRPHTARVYLCHVTGGQRRLSSETLDVGWFDTTRLPRMLLPWYRQPIADGLSQGEQVHRRLEHQGLQSIYSAVAIDFRMRWSGQGVTPGRRS